MKVFHLFPLIFWISIAAGFPKRFARGYTKLQLMVTSLPGLFTNVEKHDIPLMFSGQIELYPENNTHYYFWKFEDNNKVERNHKRTTFWLNGGPGCSSMDGALMELGPFRINKNKEVVYNYGSWHKLSDMVFVDQPGGTGFSYTDIIDHDLDQVARDFMRFLEEYFAIFPNDSDNDIYLSGESYAGQYIPYIADAILTYNSQGKSQYNLKGLLIGNGWISPNEQSLLYLPFAIKSGILAKDNPSMPHILKQQEECQAIVNKIDAANQADSVPQLHDFETDSSLCEQILLLIIKATLNPSAVKSEQCINVYDYTLRDESPACGLKWPPGLNYMTQFLQEPSVMDNLNLKHKSTWIECSSEIGKILKARNSIPSIHLFPRILEQLPILLFHGDRDIICNLMGVQSMIQKLTWGGQRGFSEDLQKVEWEHSNSSAGFVMSERNLTLISVYNASHMVPFDKPDISRALLDLMTQDYTHGYNGGNILIRTTSVDPRGNILNERSSTTSRFARILQFAVLLVLIWGVYVLYCSYNSRPLSIIKSSIMNRTTTANSVPKKNVQWAENLRRFQLEEQIFQQSSSFLSNTIKKLRGSDSRGNYTPPRLLSPENALEAFELQDMNTAIGDDFIIASDEESLEGD